MSYKNTNFRKNESTIGSNEDAEKELWKIMKTCMKDFEEVVGCNCVETQDDPQCRTETLVPEECFNWMDQIGYYCYLRKGKKVQ